MLLVSPICIPFTLYSLTFTSHLIRFYFFRPNSNFSHHFHSFYFLPFPTYHKHNNSLFVCFFFRMCTFGDFFTPIPLFSSYYPSPGTSIKYSKFLTIKFVCFLFFIFSLLVLSFPWHHKLCDPIIIYLFLCFIFSLSFVTF